jgi:hypothetical protein
MNNWNQNQQGTNSLITLVRQNKCLYDLEFIFENNLGQESLDHVDVFDEENKKKEGKISCQCTFEFLKLS